jgi:hypothetical protein
MNLFVLFPYLLINKKSREGLGRNKGTEANVYLGPSWEAEHLNNRPIGET